MCCGSRISRNLNRLTGSLDITILTMDSFSDLTWVRTAMFGILISNMIKHIVVVTDHCASRQEEGVLVGQLRVIR